jgi:cyclic pyranopterin phosphate synthase
MAQLSHLDERGRAQMVDVSGKADTVREARARGRVNMAPATLALIQQGGVAKGDVIAVARLAGIMAAKRTGELIPLCHPLPITSVEIAIEPAADRPALEIEATARVVGKTGVEMPGGIGNLRHVQGRGPLDDHRRHPPGAQAGGQERGLPTGGRGWRMSHTAQPRAAATLTTTTTRQRMDTTLPPPSGLR